VNLAHILEEPEDPARYAVLGDALTAKGDPWGELITVQHAEALEKNKTKKGKLRREGLRLAAGLGKKLVGDLAMAGKAAFEPEWFCGFLAGVRIRAVAGDVLADWVRALAKAPAARVLRRLTLVCALPRVDFDGAYHAFEQPFGGALTALSELPRTLRELQIGDDEHDLVAGHLEVSDFGPALAALPIESLVINVGRANPGPSGMPGLKRLALRLTEMTPAALQQLAATKWPALERLEVWTGECELSSINTSYEQVKKHGRKSVASLTVRGVQRMYVNDHYGGLRWAQVREEDLEALVPPRTVEVGLCNLLFTNELVALLPKLDWLKRIRVLDLSKGTLSTEGAQALIKKKASFARLESLILDENLLTPEEVTAISAALPNAKIGPQRTGRSPAHMTRYVQSFE
jgi:hypothetical protein